MKFSLVSHSELRLEVEAALDLLLLLDLLDEDSLIPEIETRVGAGKHLVCSRVSSVSDNALRASLTAILTIRRSFSFFPRTFYFKRSNVATLDLN